MDINQEITKHLEWIEAIASLIGNEAISEEDIQKLSQHDRCELGRWLSSGESAEFKDFPEFERLEDSHNAFHTLAGELITALEARNEDQAVASEEAFVAASQEVVGYLKALQGHAAKDDGP